VNLSNEDVQDILRLLETLPYGEFVLETSQFTLRLRRGQDGLWEQEHSVLTEPTVAELTGPTVAGTAANGPAGPPSAAAVRGRTPSAAPASAAPDPPAPDPTARPVAPAPTGPVSAGPVSAGPVSAGPDPSVPDPSGHSPVAPTTVAGPPAAPRAAGPSGGPEAGLREVRTPLPGTFYRAPGPGAAPYVEVGGEVGQDTVVAIIETMKLMNPVYAGTVGTVAEICLADGEFAPQDTVLIRVSARAG
jgi:acetyl-CoA carboxylase biotin carboxyl carrier protein